MIDLQTIKNKTDILAVFEKDLGQPVKHNGKYYFWNCPLHGDNTPSLSVTPDNGRWYCFGCSKGGDIFTWMLEYHKLSFKDALRELNNGDSLPVRINQPAYKPEPKPLPADDLQEKWKRIIDVCHNNLFDTVNGLNPLLWLHERGLNNNTLQSPFWRVGYSTGATIEGIQVRRGITIPCYTVNTDLTINQVNYIKIRQPVDNPKYLHLPGGISGLYGASRTLSNCDILWLTEGEFDCLLLGQEGGDWFGGGFSDVCTLGSVTGHIDFGRNGHYFLKAKHIITVFDNDDPGDTARAEWEKLSPKVKSARIPQGKDITEYWQQGGDLAAWANQTLSDFGILAEYGL